MRTNLHRDRDPSVNTRTIELYHQIVAYFAEWGFMPTIRELSEMTGVASTDTIKHHRDMLQKWGWIDFQPQKARAMTLTRPAERGLKPSELQAARRWIKSR